jgi:hypothetical protein
MGCQRSVKASLLIVAAIVALPLYGEPLLRSREGGLQNRPSSARSRSAGRSHLVLQMETAPGPADAARLAGRGIHVVAYLPPDGVMVSLRGAPDFRGLGVRAFDALQPEDKMSRAIGRDRARPRFSGQRSDYLVEFHSDVPAADRRALIRELGLDPRFHPDLAPDHLLVRGRLEQVARLADWDEVAYVFPASEELSGGLPLIGCLGGATEAGQVGQLTRLVGEGWDGPGRNGAELTYSFQAITRKVATENAKSEIVRALDAWSRVARLRFARKDEAGGSRNINILFGAGAHGDSYPFDGPGRVLAHTFYPAPPNPEPIAGDLHFDEDETWSVGTDVDIFSVALHELGHALGLGHSDVPGAVMYPYYRRVTALTDEDIGAIRMLYAEPEAAPSAPATPLHFTVETPAATFTTSGSSINAEGAAAGAVAPASVRWTSDRGGAGIGVVANDRWQVLSMPLSPGENRITLSLVDAASRTATASLVILRRIEEPPVTPPAGPAEPDPPAPQPPPVPAPPVPDPPVPNPPQPGLSIHVTSPASGAQVRSASVLLRGTIAGAAGVPAVEWRTGAGASGAAQLRTSAPGAFEWEVPAVPLRAGLNAIQVSVVDAGGAARSLSLAVTYTPLDDTPPSGADTTAPRLTITSPNTTFLMTSGYSIGLRGTASDSNGVREVRWTCSCGTSGLAQGTSQWTIPNISFPPGTSTIQVTARDAAGNAATARLTVFRYGN